MSRPGWAVHIPTGQDPVSVDVVAAGSLPAEWARLWSRNPSQEVILDLRKGSWMSAGELEESSRRAASRLLGAGVEPGERLLISCGSSAQLVVAHVGALRAGLVVVPANPAYTAREMAHIVADSKPAAAIVDDPARASLLDELAGGLIVAGPDLQGLPGVARPHAGLVPPGPGAPALMAYTSGTTGKPKGALHTHSSLLASARSVGLAWRWEPADRLVLALPLFHGHGLCVGLHGTLLAGASAVVHDGFDVDVVLESLREHRATLFFGVPTMYHRMAASPRAGELSALRLAVSGSAALPAGLHRRIQESSGQAVLERYGTSETLMNVSNPYEGDRRPGTVGFPLPGVEIDLSEAGEILVRGPNVFAGYWGAPDKTAEAMEGGWYHTGDLGELDPDGYLRILGRSKDLIITGGYNVYPREVEEVLASHPDVEAAAVVGEPSDEWGEVVRAFVVAAGTGCDADTLLGFARGELAAYKVPRRVSFVDSLPRNALGKVVKNELRSG